jgi:hypothetical protein
MFIHDQTAKYLIANLENGMLEPLGGGGGTCEPGGPGGGAR